MKLILDLDSTVVDLYTPWLGLYNEKYDDDITIEDVPTWSIHKHVKPECGVKIYELLNTPELFTGIKPLSGALEGVKALHDQGHQIVVCSSATWPRGAMEKTIWVQKNLPFLDRNDVVLAGNKHHVFGHVLIDDSPEQHDKYRAEWPAAKIVGISWPYNLNTPFDLRAESYRNTEAAWDEIVNYIGRL